MAKKEYLDEMHADELERLQNMGELMVFEDTPTSDYLAQANPEDWKLETTLKEYHPVGSEDYLKDLEEEKRRK